MNQLRWVLFLFFLTHLNLMPNVFSEQYMRWGLPVGAKTRYGKR